MTIYRFSIFTFVLLCQQMFGWTLLEQLKKTAPQGDCLILEQASTIYALKVTGEALYIAKAPETLFKNSTYSSWIAWLEDGAPGALETAHTSISELKTEFPELCTLLTMPWERVPTEDRKKKGSTPLSGEIDFRPEWNPKVTVDGVVLKNCPTIAWYAYWPKDGSEAADKKLVAYFPESDKTVSWFPYWIEFPGIKSVIFVIDSKKGSSVDKQPSLPL